MSVGLSREYRRKQSLGAALHLVKCLKPRAWIAWDVGKSVYQQPTNMVLGCNPTMMGAKAETGAPRGHGQLPLHSKVEGDLSHVAEYCLKRRKAVNVV